jgi:diguanylate cyclase (GGDEF)-like protein/PAS domain S-box-containing protein
LNSRSDIPLRTLLSGQIRALEMIARDAPLAHTLEELLRVIESESPGLIASVLLLDEQGLHLHHGAAPSLPASYTAAIDGQPIGERAGSCGTAAYLKKPVMVADIDTDPLWAQYRGVAMAHGLRACWSTPIFDAAGRLLGTFALYFRTPAKPTSEHTSLIEIATHIAAIAITRAKDERERARLMRELRGSEARVRGILESMIVGFVAMDRELRFSYVNPRAARLLGQEARAMLGRTYLEVFPELEGSSFEAEYRRVLAEGITLQSEAYFPLEKRWFEQRVAPTPEGVAVFFQDTTKRKNNESRIEYLATHDGLTGLPNRNLIRDRIRQTLAVARRAGRQAAVLYIDLDRFKVANDGFGHAFGDRLLVEVGKRLRQLLREGDTVARLGGDEFMILLVDLARSTDVYVLAQRAIECFHRPFNLEEREIVLSASIGVSLFPQDGQTAETLIGNADAAMYRAKNLGGDAYQFFTGEMSEATRRRVEVETQLRSAVSRSELHLAYQPKVELASGRISGCEALLRWTNPVLGPVPPGRFIPIAEDSGLIVSIGDWVLNSACAQAKAWQDAGLPMNISVNLSLRQFLQRDIVAWTLEALQRSGLAPERLELEITESIIAQDVEKVIRTVDALKAAGVRLSIDDFGTGYSSLSYLKRFRVDALKIDQSFMRGLEAGAEDTTIVLAMISLAHNLGLKAVAEGVETESHRRFLRQHGCDEMQGSLFSKPLPAPEFEAMLREGRRLN